jgi:hypothetical protein
MKKPEPTFETLAMEGALGRRLERLEQAMAAGAPSDDEGAVTVVSWTGSARWTGLVGGSAVAQQKVWARLKSEGTVDPDATWPPARAAWIDAPAVRRPGPPPREDDEP